MTIAIIDKHPVTRQGLVLFFKEHFGESTTLTAESIAAFYDAFPGQAPALLILGVLPYQDNTNLAMIKLLKKRFVAASIIVFDNRPDLPMAPQYLLAGANAYISKKNSLAELLQCVKTALKGERYICYDKTASFKAPPYAHYKLSTREYEIAKYLSLGMKTSRIANILKRDLSTISNLKTTLFKKLQVHSVSQLIQLIQENEVYK